MKEEINCGYRIRSLCKEKNIELKELASALGLSYSSVCQYSGGTRMPSRKTQKKMAEFFDVDAEYLMGQTNVKHLSNYVEVIKKDYSDEEVELLSAYRSAPKNIKKAIKILLEV